MAHVIIGGAGFVGRFLARKLIERGERVICCDMQDNHLDQAEFRLLDITDESSIENLPLTPFDTVYHLAARQYHSSVPRFRRQRFFDEVNTTGTRFVLEHMARAKCKKMIFFSTDMIYGNPRSFPVRTDHVQCPNGEYGNSKKKSELLIREYRRRNMNITIFRPRLIIGPGRLGVLEKLFSNIRKNLPVPIIGDGKNCYQMVSVHDCVSAIICALDKNVPNSEYNLGSEDPPCVYDLLLDLIQSKGSSSKILKIPGLLVKNVLTMLDWSGLTILYPEQFAVADKTLVLDISHTRDQLNWQPRYTDSQMLAAAYDQYIEPRRESRRSFSLSHAASAVCSLWR